MSLFGESPPRPTQTKSSLFDEGTPSKTGAGLFPDGDDNSNPTQSPWDFPTPRKAARRDLVRSLLPDSIVPRQYVTLVDAVLASGPAAHGNISSKASTDLVQKSGLNAEDQRMIIGLVTGGADGLTRSEVNVILALIALAQKGEDICLDAVDERKQALPVPSLPHINTTTSTDLAQPKTRDEPGSLDAVDPWGGPEMHKGHDHAAYASNAAGSQPSRTTSSFTTAPSETTRADRTPFGSINRAPSAVSNGWAADDRTASSNPTQSAFTEPVANGHAQAKMLAPGRTGTAVEEAVTISSLDGKEGVFMFQHRNYEVVSQRRNSKVVRRYSDFVWLLDCLHKKYPFRQLPLLPPKRVAINGNHLAADTLFIEKRRRGLVRFVNALVRHPVLGQEQLVTMFLTVPTELSVWRKQASVSAQEEFAGKALPAGLEESLPATLDDTFDKVRAGVRRAAEQYIHICTAVEKLTKYNTVLANEYNRFARCLTTLSETTNETYAVDANDVPLLNEGLTANVRHLGTYTSLLDSEATAWEGGFLEDVKRQRDCLVSVRDMFDRRDRYNKDNIPQLERKILANENKLAVIRAKADAKPGEAAKVEDAIVKDKQSIVEQHARGVFVKECIRDELVYFNSSQYHISRLHQDWSQERVKYAELMADNWRRLSEEIEAMPTGE